MLRTKESFNTVLQKTLKLYGPVMTFWFGPLPIVFITDVEIGRETFMKIKFSGRPKTYFGKHLMNLI